MSLGGRVSRSSALLLACVACSAQRLPAVPTPAASASDDSPICKAVMDRFVGIPSLDEGAPASQARALAGRWWIRGCSAKRVANGVRIRLSGPGWYFIDQRSHDFALRQQIPFTLGIELEGAPRFTVTNGVAALSFAPRVAPQVHLHLDGDLSVRATSAWGKLLGWVPLVSVPDMAANQLSTAAVTALQAELSDGATATYDLGSGQSDVAFGKLPPGQVPKHAFPDRARWVVNDRLFLPPAATQVVGPFEPGRTRLDVQIEQGAGLAYRAVCQDDMLDSYPAIASGHVEALPARATVADGTISGLGKHSDTFDVARCKFLVVVSTLDQSTTVAALRVRG